MLGILAIFGKAIQAGAGYLKSLRHKFSQGVSTKAVGYEFLVFSKNYTR
jgi:hypothetical protein